MLESSNRKRSNAMLQQAPRWFIEELRSEGYATPDGLPNDHSSYSKAQQAVNLAHEERLRSETAIERVRRIAREKRRRAGR